MKVLSVFGTRPEAIKMAPLVKKLSRDRDFETVLVVTAQHRQMLDQVLDLFSLKPDYDLDVMREQQTIGMITSKVLEGMGEVLDREKPDLVLVHGDTTTTFSSCLASFYRKIPVAHVEAGLRTYNMYSPFPEEMNRVLTDSMSSLYFCPTVLNRDNLLKENVPEEKIFITGNTVIDALLLVSQGKYTFTEEVLRDLNFKEERVILLTCHRRENLGENMGNIFRAVKRIVSEYDDVKVVYPVHLNPKVREKADEILKGVNNVYLIEPLSYEPFVHLMKNSYLVLTDSGGIQEEAPSLAKPVLVVRKETERPEAIEAGTVKLAGVHEDSIYEMVKTLLDNKEEYLRMGEAVNPYGDGKASERIIEAVKKWNK